MRTALVKISSQHVCVRVFNKLDRGRTKIVIIQVKTEETLSQTEPAQPGGVVCVWLTNKKNVRLRCVALQLGLSQVSIPLNLINNSNNWKIWRIMSGFENKLLYSFCFLSNSRALEMWKVHSYNDFCHYSGPITEYQFYRNNRTHLFNVAFF